MLDKILATKQINVNLHGESEDITVQVLISRGRVGIAYYIPKGMSGCDFSLFKTKFKLVIDSLKSTYYEKEERQPTDIDCLPAQCTAQEYIPHDLTLQKY